MRITRTLSTAACALALSTLASIAHAEPFAPDIEDSVQKPRKR